VTQKPLVLWDSDLRLTTSTYSEAALAMVRLYHKVAKSSNRMFVLCLSKQRAVSNIILSLFDQVFVFERRKGQCIRNRLGDITDIRHPSVWRYHGPINHIRRLILLTLFASAMDRSTNTKDKR
jgi:hypothetical protein